MGFERVIDAERARFIEECAKAGLWIAHNSLVGSYWWTPNALGEANAAGQFRWSVENFQAIEPARVIEQLRHTAVVKQQELQAALEALHRAELMALK